jgi:L-arabinokinase
LTLRLPFHGGFQTMLARLRDIPLIARRASRPRSEIRRLLGIQPEATVVLASFGGYGLLLPFARIARDNGFTLLLTDHERRGVRSSATSANNGSLVSVEIAALARRGIYYPDLVGAADVVVSKPGYGIVSECIANGAALLYTDRGRFAEHDVFVAQMPDVLRCRFVPQDDLLAGRWHDAVSALLRQPAPQQSLNTNGATVAADVILST